jgi:hypothetical protein
MYPRANGLAPAPSRIPAPNDAPGLAGLRRGDLVVLVVGGDLLYRSRQGISSTRSAATSTPLIGAGDQVGSVWVGHFLDHHPLNQIPQPEKTYGAGKPVTGL